MQQITLVWRFITGYLELWAERVLDPKLDKLRPPLWWGDQ